MTDQRGLHEKFIVRRKDGTDQPGLKHHGCRYFVLDLTHDDDALIALHAYAISCRDTRPVLSRDLLRMIREVEEKKCHIPT